MRLGIAQHGARLSELRKILRGEGREIVNCIHHSDSDGRKHSDYAIMPSSKPGFGGGEWRRA